MPRSGLPIGGGRFLAQNRVKTPAQSAPRTSTERHQ
jgi:hypothetical protein